MVLEILISTMNRKDLSFLDKIFVNNAIEDLNVLIINQTNEKNILKSNLKNVRVINSFEYGLSKSRNLAIKNAIGDICLIADDDVEYVKGFHNSIKEAFLEHKAVSVIKFKIGTYQGRDYKVYPNKSKTLSKIRDVNGISSVEICFKRKDIETNNILFNEFFGLGSMFKSGEEFLFLVDVLKKGLSVYFKNVTIVKHTFERTTTFGSDEYIKSRAAIYYITYGGFSYLFLLKLTFFLLRKRIIKFNQFYGKFHIGLRSIKTYKTLKRTEVIYTN